MNTIALENRVTFQATPIATGQNAAQAGSPVQVACEAIGKLFGTLSLVTDDGLNNCIANAFGNMPQATFDRALKLASSISDNVQPRLGTLNNKAAVELQHSFLQEILNN